MAGRLYTWAAAIDSVKLANDADNPQDCGFGKTCDLASAGSATLVLGICPSGWHLPSQTEWNTLFTAVGGSFLTAGKVLKSQTGWYSNGNGTDAFGFSALPAGYRGYDGYFTCDGYNADFWSSIATARTACTCALSATVRTCTTAIRAMGFLFVVSGISGDFAQTSLRRSIPFASKNPVGRQLKFRRRRIPIFSKNCKFYLIFLLLSSKILNN